MLTDNLCLSLRTSYGWGSTSRLPARSCVARCRASRCVMETAAGSASWAFCLQWQRLPATATTWKNKLRKLADFPYFGTKNTTLATEEFLERTRARKESVWCQERSTKGQKKRKKKKKYIKKNQCQQVTWGTKTLLWGCCLATFGGSILFPCFQILTFLLRSGQRLTPAHLPRWPSSPRSLCTWDRQRGAGVPPSGKQPAAPPPLPGAGHGTWTLCSRAPALPLLLLLLSLASLIAGAASKRQVKWGGIIPPGTNCMAAGRLVLGPEETRTTAGPTIRHFPRS